MILVISEIYIRIKVIGKIIGNEVKIYGGIKGEKK
jgi:hypothetical protein